MTRIIEFLIALAIVAVLFLIIGVALPSHRHLSESVETNRKLTIVYDTVNSFRRFKDWNPLVLHDPALTNALKLSGAEEGVGARMDYDSSKGDIGQGHWEISESVPNKQVTFRVESPSRGKNKVVNFLLEPTGKNGRNVKITQTYDVDYGWDLVGRYAGLYVGGPVGDDMKMGLGRLATMLTSVPNVDYAEQDLGLGKMVVTELPAEDLLIVNAGNIDRTEDAIRTSIRNNQEWIKRVMDSNGLEAAGPVRIVTTDLGQEKYAFDVAVPVRKKAGTAPAAAAPDQSASVAAQGEPLNPAIPAGAPVAYKRTEASRAVSVPFTGDMGGLETVRNMLRAWAVTRGYELTERPFDAWKNGVDKAFSPEGEFDVYWRIK
ncbi:MAG: SRPBCC family protein [Xanthomonadaceae bacterium]|jgi:hypothetical protein|nr:SRPBCC family protein [Xanthomonadaceae bacterium]